MKTGTKLLMIALTACEAVLAVALFNVLRQSEFTFGKYFVLIGVVVLSLGLDWLIMRQNSATVISDAKKLKDADDYIRAFEAWLNEDTPFSQYIKLAINQLESLKRKQQALRTILDDSTENPFFTTADEVDQYVLANCKRILNRVMIYDKNDSHKLQMHITYLQSSLGENAHVLSDFENLILEISQIGDSATAASTPCLNELTNALRSVRSSGLDDSAMQQNEIPPQQMRMQ